MKPGLVTLLLALASCSCSPFTAPGAGSAEEAQVRMVYVDTSADIDSIDISGLPAGSVDIEFVAYSLGRWREADTESVVDGVSVMHAPTRKRLVPKVFASPKGDTAVVRVSVLAEAEGSYVFQLAGARLHEAVVAVDGYSIPEGLDRRASFHTNYFIRTVGTCRHVRRIRAVGLETERTHSMEWVHRWAVDLSEPMSADALSSLPSSVRLEAASGVPATSELPTATIEFESGSIIVNLPPREALQNGTVELYSITLPAALGAGGFWSSLDCRSAPYNLDMPRFVIRGYESVPGVAEGVVFSLFREGLPGDKPHP